LLVGGGTMMGYRNYRTKLRYIKWGYVKHAADSPTFRRYRFCWR